MHCKECPSWVFGGNSIFETWPAVKIRFFLKQNSRKNPPIWRVGQICKKCHSKIFSWKFQSNKVRKSFWKSNGHLLAPPPPPLSHLRRPSVLALTHFIDSPPPLPHSCKIVVRKKTGILMQQRWAWIAPWTSTWIRAECAVWPYILSWPVVTSSGVNELFVAV